MGNEILGAGQNVESSRRWSPTAASVLIHITALAAIVLIPSSMDKPAVPVRTVALVTPLVYRPVILTHPTPRPARITLAKVVPPPPKLPEPAPKVIAKPSPFVAPEAPRPKTVAVQMPQEVRQEAAPLALVHLDAPALPARAAVPVPVKVGTFSTPGTSVAGRAPSPRLDVLTGGFEGNGGASAGHSGAASGNGRAVQTGGFGDGTGSGNGSSGRGRQGVVVADAGFGNLRAEAPPPRRAEAAPAETPVEVLWKPKPRYTEEARAKKLEGDVVLEVVFRAAGDVRVIRVVRGLGSGLDESARTAAEQIRFHPGKRDGVAVDRTGLVQITFELT